MNTFGGIRFDPTLPVWLLAVLGVACVLALALAAVRRARGTWLRAVALLVLLGWLAGPRLVRETREGLHDIALLVVDETASMTIGDRAAIRDRARRQIVAAAAQVPDLDLRTVTVPPGRQGTQLFGAIERAMADIPRGRLAGVIALTDGQVHDLPAIPDLPAPLHVLIPAAGEETDRRLRVVEAPSFGVVGRSVTLKVVVEDLGPAQPGSGQSGPATLTLRRDGDPPRTVPITPGREQSIELPITRAGPSVVELEASPLPGEASLLNNRAVVSVNGVRDRLRVLLVSGEPHMGERTWRRLLKADPSVDLVHFTILRPPDREDPTPLNELALIAFPVRELFQVKINEFDLIILDRFQNRNILPAAYLRNIADYVRQGGGLLMSVGPEFANAGTSLANSPIGTVLPARPAGMVEGAFLPRVTRLGARHPVTEDLPGSGDTPAWGPWYRRIAPSNPGGQPVMSAPDGAPLLLLDHVGQGRTALLLSDQIWLWSRGHGGTLPGGGGPQAELLRRVAHWLMKEPSLDEERLDATIEPTADGDVLRIVRRTLSDAPPPPVTVTGPGGAVSRVTLVDGRAAVPAVSPGVWQVTDGVHTAFAAAQDADPLEISDLRATGTVLGAAARATGGGVHFIADALPALRRTEPGRDASGRDWIGLVRRRDHLVTGLDSTPLLPAWLALPLLLGLALVAWRREGNG